MNLDEISQALAELANCGDPVFAKAAEQVKQQTQQTLMGQLSKEELCEILGDMQRQLDIIQEMNQLAFKEKLNAVITGIIAIASAV
jgi:uncharacterized FlaG/YvyC family protein